MLNCEVGMLHYKYVSNKIPILAFDCSKQLLFEAGLGGPLILYLHFVLTPVQFILLFFVQKNERNKKRVEM